ncbi:sensor histidine kinase [Nitrincola schmidtii]|uniref:sensor histidine kinase n=1 Tax=Nitrincola schmidtii TaxID=1730894 RepID=UPI001456FE06|nr:sensor histidine kinase [Nitrincola schmidtii]
MSSSFVYAQVVFNAHSTAVSLNGQMQFLPDDDNELLLADVLVAQAEGRMHKLPGRLNRGYAPVASWLNVVVINDGALPVAPTLLMEPPYLDEVDVYIRDGVEPGQPQDYRRVSVGDHTPVANQPLPTALMTVPLLIEPGASINIFIRVHSYSAHNLAAQLVSPSELHTKTARHLLWQSAYIAIAFALAIINFLLALRLRDKINAMYGLYVLSVAVSTLGIEGIVRLLMPQTAHLLADWFVGAGVGLTFASVTLFVMFLFNTAKHHPWVYRYQQVIIVSGLIMALSSGTAWYPSITEILNFNVIFMALLNPWLAWRSIKRGEVATGRWFLIAFGVNSLGVLITILGVLGILPLHEYTRHAVQFTTTFHILVMMLGLAERVLAAEATLRKASAHAEENALVIASQMNEELIASKQQLEQSLMGERRMRDEQGRFIDTISHEYRTPLSIVRTNLDIIHAKQQIDEKRFGVITTALSRFENIFSDALHAHNLGRPPQPKFTTIDLKALLDEAMIETHQAVPHCHFDYRKAPEKFNIFGDAGLIFTVLRNLLGNATKYCSHDTVLVTLNHAGEHAVLVIENAIDPHSVHDREKLFERWERGASVAGKSGMGLGLYIVRRIVQDHAGDVTIATVPSDRFIVTLKLPLLQGDVNG